MIVFKAHPKPVADVTFTPDGTGLVTGSQAGVAVWQLDSRPERVVQFEMADVWLPSAVAVSPCGRYLARSGRAFELIELESRRVIASTVLLARSVGFSPDGREVAMTQQDQPLVRWSVPDGNGLPGGWGGSRSSNNGTRFPAGALAYSPDGATLAITYGVLDGDRFHSHIVLFDRATGRQLADLRAASQFDHPRRIVYSPDGGLIAGNFGPVVGVIEAASGKDVVKVREGKKHVTGLVFTPDGRQLLAVSNDRRVRAYDTATWSQLVGYEWGIGKLSCLAIAPDGLRAAAGSDTGKVVVWDVDG